MVLNDGDIDQMFLCVTHCVRHCGGGRGGGIYCEGLGLYKLIKRSICLTEGEGIYFHLFALILDDLLSLIQSNFWGDQNLRKKTLK
jgi:hypothetical protein